MTQRPGFITREGQKSKRWELAVLLVAVVLVSGLVVSEFVSQRMRDFSADRPITASVISSFVLSLFAIGVIELALKRNESRRWHGATGVLRGGMTDDLRHLRDAMIGLSTGAVPYEEELVLLDDGVLNETRQALVRNGSYACTLCRGSDRIETLELIMGDGEWVETTFAGVRSMSRWYRERVANWMLSGAPTPIAWDLVQSFAEISNAMEELQRPMYPVHRDATGAVRAEHRRVAAESWERVIVATIIVEELARRTGTHDPYTGRPDEKTDDEGRPLPRVSSEVWGSTARHLVTEDSAALLDRFDLSVEELKGFLHHAGLRTESSAKAWPRRWAQNHRCGPAEDACPTAARIWEQQQADSL